MISRYSSYLLQMIVIMIIFITTEASTSTVYIDNTPYIRLDWDWLNSTKQPPIYNYELESRCGDDQISINNRSSNNQWNTATYYYNPCVYGRETNDNIGDGIYEPLIFDTSLFKQPIDERLSYIFTIKQGQTMILDIDKMINAETGKTDPIFLCINGTLLTRGINLGLQVIEDWWHTGDLPKTTSILNINGIYVFESGRLLIGHGSRINLTNELYPKYNNINISLNTYDLPSIISFGGVIESNITKNKYNNQIQFVNIEELYVSNLWVGEFSPPDAYPFTSTKFGMIDNHHLSTQFIKNSSLGNDKDERMLFFSRLPRVIALSDHSCIQGGSIHLLEGSRGNLKNVLFMLNPPQDRIVNDWNGINVRQGSSLSIDNSIFYLNESYSDLQHLINSDKNRNIRGLISVHHSKLNISNSYFHHQCQSVIIGEWGTEDINSFNNTFVGIPPPLPSSSFNPLPNNNNNYQYNFNNNSLIDYLSISMNGSAITSISPTTRLQQDRFYGSFPSSAIHIYQLINRSSIINELNYHMKMIDSKYHTSNNFNNQNELIIKGSTFNLLDSPPSQQQHSIIIESISNINNSGNTSISQHSFNILQLDDNLIYNSIKIQSTLIGSIIMNNCTIFNSSTNRISFNNNNNNNNETITLTFNNLSIEIDKNSNDIRYNHIDDIFNNSNILINPFQYNYINKRLYYTNINTQLNISINNNNNNNNYNNNQQSIPMSTPLQYSITLDNINNNQQIYQNNTLCIWRYQIIINNTIISNNTITNTPIPSPSQTDFSCKFNIQPNNTNSILSVDIVIQYHYNNDVIDIINANYRDIFIIENNKSDIILQAPFNNNTIQLPYNSNNNNPNYLTINLIFQIIPTWNEYYQLFNEYIGNDYIPVEYIDISIILFDSHYKMISKSYCEINQPLYNNDNRIQYINTTIYVSASNDNNNNISLSWYQSLNGLANGEYLDIDLYSLMII